MITTRKKNEFSSESVIQDLNTLIRFKKGQQQNVQSLSEINLTFAMSATSALIKYLDVSILIKKILFFNLILYYVLIYFFIS